MNEKIRTSRPPAKSPPRTVPGGTVPNLVLKRWAPVILAVVAVLVVAIVAVRAFMPVGQPSNFGRSLSWLLTQKSVQEELKITPEQSAKITKYDDDRYDALAWSATRNLTQYDKEKKAAQLDLAFEKSLPRILDAEQLKRLKQIYLQQRGKRAWTDEEVAEAFKLTRQQKDELKTLQEKQQIEMGELMRRSFGGNPDDAKPPVTKEEVDELRKTQDEQLMGALTPQQLEMWQQMLGALFTGQIDPPPRGGWNVRFGGP